MSQTMQYYLSKGFDEKSAAYFAGGRRTITSVTPNKDFSLTLIFDNGEIRRYDMTSFISPNTVFAPLANRESLDRVNLDDTICVSWDIDPNVDSSVVWNNQIDLCPDSCYIDSIPV